MEAKVLHQVGHNDKWNRDSLSQDGAGDGLIFSPLHQKKSSIEAFSESLKKRSLFDPQFYLPNSPKRHLSTYPFFPEVIADGFSTNMFTHFALDAARQCIQFQMEQNFEAVVVPARFEKLASTKYFDRHMAFTVEPFLRALRDLGVKSDAYLTLPVTSAMIEDADFRIELLNWVTSFPEITGIYVIVADERKSKQIQSQKSIEALLEFASDLRSVKLKVIVGHQNSESVVMALVDGVSLTMGAYENTRMFSLDKFLEADDQPRAPKPRIYVPKLHNWIQFDHARQIRIEDRALWDRLFVPTQYSEAAFDSPLEPHFSQPALYKHHFIVMSQQLKELMALSAENRWKRLREEFRGALGAYEAIADLPVDLDFHGRGGHIQVWLDSCNSYGRKYLKDATSN